MEKTPSQWLLPCYSLKIDIKSCQKLILKWNYKSLQLISSLIDLFIKYWGKKNLEKLKFWHSFLFLVEWCIKLISSVETCFQISFAAIKKRYISTSDSYKAVNKMNFKLVTIPSIVKKLSLLYIACFTFLEWIVLVLFL